MLITDTERVADALRAIPDLTQVTRGYPKRVEALPCASVAEADQRGAAWGDDDAYARRVAMDVRLYTVTSAQQDALTPLIDDAMRALGYRFELSYVDDTSEIRMAVLRYWAVFPGV